VTFGPGARRFVQHDHTIGFLCTCQNRFFVERSQRTQVDHFDIEAFLLEFLRRVERGQHHRAKRNNRQIASFTRSARLADFDNVVVRRQLLTQTRQPVKFLVFEIQNRIGIANRRFDQTLGVVGRRWLNDFQTGSIKKKRLGIQRMKRSGTHT